MTTPPHTLLVKCNDPMSGSSEYYLQSHLYDIRPYNGGILQVIKLGKLSFKM